MKNEAAKNREILYSIRNELFVGAISYDEAKAKAAPIIEQINAESRRLAKKYGMKPQLVSFGAIMR